MGDIVDIRELMEEAEMARKKSKNPKIEFMRRYIEAERRIPMKQERIQRQRQKLIPGAANISGMPSGGKGKDIGDAIGEILLMIERNEADIRRMRRDQEQILDAIERVPESDMRALLEGRYLNGWKWEKIAEYIHCDTSTAWRLHGAALKMLELPAEYSEKNAAAG